LTILFLMFFYNSIYNSICSLEHHGSFATVVTRVGNERTMRQPKKNVHETRVGFEEGRSLVEWGWEEWQSVVLAISVDTVVHTCRVLVYML
jgi:hypothetical protein